MNLKLYRILAILSITALAMSIMPNVYSEEPRQDFEKRLTTGFPLDVATKANERAELLIKTIEDSNNIPQHQKTLQNKDYQVSYTEDGYVSQITYTNGFSIKLLYEKSENGKISGVSFVMTDPSKTGQLDNSDLEDLLHLKAQDLPLKITIRAKSDEPSFSRLLSSLKKGTNSPTTSGTSSIDFTALKQIFHDFKKNQEIAFNHYTTQTQNYYDTLAPLLKEDLSASHSTTPSKKEIVNKRSEIDYRVDQLLNESRGNTDLQGFKAKITGLQPILSDTYIAPSRERLRKTVEKNISTLQNRLYEMFILGGVTTTIHTDETSTEIIILLP